MSAVAAPPSAASASSLSRIKPLPTYPANATLYLSNIDWSIKKPLLKRALFTLFTRHGKVLEVIVLRGDTSTGGKKRPLRGQAWVIFESVQAATAALAAERGFVFFGRPLMVNYAKEVSDRIAKRDGTYKKSKGKRKAEDEAALGEGGGKMVRVEEKEVKSNADASKHGIEPTDTPSSTLLAQNIPPECNEMMLSMLFKQYSGFQKVKSHSGGVYTIDFDSEREATSAMNGLNGFKLNASSVLDLKYRQ
ncbi:hypothetical protein HJC23_000319 [Cyclotella cryptica]|uniref:RRM domain-containing protein n=1 Tax=Cyclotella cryptica TaxID=29204 RepID=A0ABD3P8H5_9STRA|eukprot:CCRYP_017159-RA/>CCRYP_017159-RA protein AED:0.00 eAED:0.00 QI:191/-1/1/1/-1/1/1/296/248